MKKINVKQRPQRATEVAMGKEVVSVAELRAKAQKLTSDKAIAALSGEYRLKTREGSSLAQITVRRITKFVDGSAYRQVQISVKKVKAAPAADVFQALEKGETWAGHHKRTYVRLWWQRSKDGQPLPNPIAKIRVGKSGPMAVNGHKELAALLK